MYINTQQYRNLLHLIQCMMIQYLYSKEHFFIDHCTAAESDEKCLMTICMKRTRFGWKEYLDQHLDEHLNDEGAQLELR